MKGLPQGKNIESDSNSNRLFIEIYTEPGTKVGIFFFSSFKNLLKDI